MLYYKNMIMCLKKANYHNIQPLHIFPLNHTLYDLNLQ